MSSQQNPTETIWQWPLKLGNYDRSPERSPVEAAELNRIWRLTQSGKVVRRSAPMKERLARLMQPIEDVLNLMLATKNQRSKTFGLMLRDMGRTQKAFWGWSPQDWQFSLMKPTPYKKHLQDYRAQVVSLAYLLCGFTEFHLVPVFQISHLAEKVFGHEAVSIAVDRVRVALNDFGYSHPKMMDRLPYIVSLILLTNRSPSIETLRIETLDYLYEVQTTFHKGHISRITRALHVAGIVARPVSANPKAIRGEPEEALSGIAPEWAKLAWRWHETSTLAPNTRRIRYCHLLKAGRWLAANHPEIVSPEQWAREIAAEYIAAIDRMHSGEWVYIEHPRNLGKPLTPSSKAELCASIRLFFMDCQRWGWIPIRFDPRRSLATPSSIRSLLGPNPRIIPDDVWAKLLAAGLCLTGADLPKPSSGAQPTYPLEMVRALVIVWLFAGLRSDEIFRLRVGCIRWDLDEASKQAGSRICLLDVPVNKTGAAFTKPVDAVVGEAVAAWEAVRPTQAPLLDSKTGEMVHFLFMHRGRWMAKAYLNEKIIPLLCHKAGVPKEDARGPITSHRARPTIASQLFNAREPMSLFELQAWLGHSNPSSTQYYARITPTKLMNSFRDADYFRRNLRMIEVLVDQDAIKTGAVQEGAPWKYYDLGHGYCTYEFFDQCPHRMACAKCPFYCPKDSTDGQLLEARSNLQRMLQEIPLTDDERAAVEDGIEAVEKLAAQLIDVPTPAGPTPRQLGIDPELVIPLLPIERGSSLVERPRK